MRTWLATGRVARKRCPGNQAGQEVDGAGSKAAPQGVASVTVPLAWTEGGRTAFRTGHILRPDSRAMASTESSLTAKMELSLPSPGPPFTLTFITLNCHRLVHVCIPDWTVSPC